MLDLDTFVTTLYVLVDDTVKLTPPPGKPGPQPGLSTSEILTLALLAQWKRFPSERSFARFAQQHLRADFPLLPDRTQLNRLIRSAHDALLTFGQTLVSLLGSAKQAYELLDGMGVAVRNNRRKGRGWLDGIAATGWSNRLGWYDGFHVLSAVDPRGVLTGYAIAPANTKDQPYAEDFLAARAVAHPRLRMVGRPASGPYLADTGYEGRERHQRWASEYGAIVLAPPRNDRRLAWPKAWRRWHARMRQIVEAVHSKWTEMFRLDDERPHTLQGFQARFAALAALHNACIWMNRTLGRPDLAFADLVDW
jgi:hypothetical protein